jgi:isopentenyl-diphosphate delta-isomerase
LKREVVDLVDIRDRKVKTATLEECLGKGLLHRAVAVMVFRPGGRLLLQQRSRNDMWHPGRWTLSCTGHVKVGESYVAAARRELSEELGLKSVLARVTKVLLPKIRSRGLVEWEFVAVFACRTGKRVAVDPDELEAVAEFSNRALLKMMNGRAMTPDAKILLRKCLRLVRNELRAAAHQGS